MSSNLNSVVPADFVSSAFDDLLCTENSCVAVATVETAIEIYLSRAEEIRCTCGGDRYGFEHTDQCALADEWRTALNIALM